MATSAPIAVIIPALNEEQTIGRVIEAIPGLADRIIVVDNGSSDGTSEVARKCGAEVISEPIKGYGRACLTGMHALIGSTPLPFAVVFLDGDLSDDPGEMESLLEPILKDEFDMVIGSRVRGHPEPGALTFTQRFGNWLSCALIKIFFGVTYTDLGPFRALRWSSLMRLKMDDPAYGWTVQMQVRAARLGMRIKEIPVNYRRRGGGKSKVSGTVKGVIGAGSTIIYVIIKEAYNTWLETQVGEPRGEEI